MFGVKPVAYANIRGSEMYPKSEGRMYLFPAEDGSVVWIEMEDVEDANEKEAEGFRGLHIHSGAKCTGDETDAFADTGTHLNLTNQEHPKHTGDLPPLLFHEGEAWMQVYTGRFKPEDVIGKTVVIHEMPDDFHSQPSGNSGAKIACGEIVKM